MADASVCPAANQLRELLTGGLSEVDSDQISGHLTHCQACQTTTQTLAAGETLLKLVRQAGREPMVVIPAEVQRVIVTMDRDRTHAPQPFPMFSPKHY